MVAGAESETANPALVLACFVAIGFIVAASLALTNAAGLSAHSRKSGDGAYIYRGAAANRLRSWLRLYPALILLVFLVFGGAILVSFETGNQSIMVVFAVLHIAVAVSSMSAICLSALAVAANDRNAGRSPPPPPP